MLVQNQDVNATVNDYKDLDRNQLLVHGLFYTVQGEGPYAGKPAVFLRLGGCNFGSKTTHCQFCDTSFALMDSTPRSFSWITEKTHELGNLTSRTNLLVITGGEPLLQPNLSRFLHYFLSQNGSPPHHWWEAQIETNGVFLFKFIQDLKRELEAEHDTRFLEDIHLVISPKASRKGYVPDYPTLKDESRVTCSLKFVYDSDPSSPHHVIPEWAKVWHELGSNVYVSPMAIYKKSYTGEVASAWEPGLLDVDATSRNYHEAAKVCMTTGYTLSIQQHLFVGMP